MRTEMVFGNLKVVARFSSTLTYSMSGIGAEKHLTQMREVRLVITNPVMTI